MGFKKKEFVKLAEKKPGRWHSHIGMAKTVAFQKKEKVVMLLLFAADLDQEIEKMGPKDYIEVNAKWRNIGEEVKWGKDKKRFVNDVDIKKPKLKKNGKIKKSKI